MATFRYRALVALSRIFGVMKRRSRLAERALDIRFSSESYKSLDAACQFQGVAIGEFYKWKCVQWAAMTEALRAVETEVLKFLRFHDQSSYAALDEALEQPMGLLIATPHYGHFLVAVAAISDYVAGRKVVNIFFDPPEKHAANQDFADFCQKMYGGKDLVNVIFNNRNGLVRAIKALRRGELVIIMPDVFDNIEDTFEVEFLSRSRSVALGTASLARMTNSAILPMVSKFVKGGCFKSQFGRVIFHEPSESAVDRVLQSHCDYKVTRRIFGQFEELIGREVLPWQYVRDHFNSPPPLPFIPKDKLGEYLGMFSSDPRVRVDLSAPIFVD